MSSQELTPRQLAESWGWSPPNDSVLAYAELATRCIGKDSFVDVAIEAGLLDASEREAALNHVAKFDEEIAGLGDYKDSLFGHLQRLMCLQGGVQYIPNMDSNDLNIHEAYERSEIKRECEELGCVLLKVQDSKNLLVFVDYDDSLTGFRQRGAMEQALSALNKNFGNDLYLAVSSRESVLGLQNIHREKNNTQGATAKVIYEAQMKSTPSLKRLASMHELALRADATDIHISISHEGNVVLKQRVHGDLERININLSTDHYKEIKQYLLKNSGAQLHYERIEEPLDGQYQYQSAGGRVTNVRASFMPLGHGGNDDSLSIRLRILPVEKGIIDLREKQVAAPVIELLENAARPSQGLILIVGPTGSGKSTTISGMIGLHQQLHGETPSRQSLEDPIERFMDGIEQVQLPHSLRGTGKGFSLFSRQLMRHDPDFIWIGEIRDAETAAEAIALSETGHLVVSSLHVKTPVEAVNRMMNLLPPERLDMKHSLIGSLTLVVGQRLVKELCPSCSTPGPVTEVEERFFVQLMKQRGITTIEMPKERRLANPEGCDECHMGYIGRLPINECLVMNASTKDLFIEGRHQKVREDRDALPITFEAGVVKLIEEGRVDFMKGLSF